MKAKLDSEIVDVQVCAAVVPLVPVNAKAAVEILFQEKFDPACVDRSTLGAPISWVSFAVKL